MEVGQERLDRRTDQDGGSRHQHQVGQFAEPQDGCVGALGLLSGFRESERGRSASVFTAQVPGDAPSVTSPTSTALNDAHHCPSGGRALDGPSEPGDDGVVRRRIRARSPWIAISATAPQHVARRALGR
jgi:hypothetical protein